MNKKHLLIFTSILFMAYAPIFFRVENWPFTDWRVFAWSYHPERVFVFSLNLKSVGKDGGVVDRQILHQIGFSPTKFNHFIYRAYVRKEHDQIKEYIKAIYDQKETRDVIKTKTCPCALVLVVKKPNLSSLEGGFQIDEKELNEYDLQAL